MPVWFPFEWEISSHLLIQFITNHTGIMPENVGPEFGDDGHRLRENGGMSKWEDKGWSLWQIAENEKRAVQRENQELVRRINKLEQSVKEARSSSRVGGNVMESLFLQLEEAVLKMMQNEQQSVGGIREEPHNRVMEKEVVEETNGDGMALAEECPATGSRECTGSNCLEQYQPDQDTTNSPIKAG